ncbi:hypothetical protein ABTN35_20460, partial [Acinetobacter baumannii]
QPAEVKSAVGSYSRAKGRSPADGGAHKWPPIITLSEADGHFFESGSSELSPQVRAALTEKIVGRLLNIIGQYDVNVIEVVGHTDEQP